MPQRLGDEHADDGGEDAEQHVDDVVVAGIDGSEPDADADEAKQTAGVPPAKALHGVDRGDEQVGGMQAGNGREDIGVLAIDAVEDVETHQAGRSAPTRLRCRAYAEWA